MTVLITLTTAGADSGPFNLYSNLDGYVSAFETGVSKASLLAGYSSALVPDYTTTIRVMSTGDCTNYIDIVLSTLTTTTTTSVPTTTTTTTSAPVACSSYSLYGVSPGIAYWTNCDGSPDSQYINASETFVVDCAIDGSVIWSGGITSLGACTTTTTTTAAPTTTTTTSATPCNSYQLIGLSDGPGCVGFVNYSYTDCSGVFQIGSFSSSSSETVCAQSEPTITCGSATITNLGVCLP